MIPGAGGGAANFFRSAGVRFGVIYAGLFGLSAVALAAFLWWSTAGLLGRQIEYAIVADLQALVDIYRTSGVPALTDAVAQRIRSNVDEDAVYMLVDDAGRALNDDVSNIERWPSTIRLDTSETVEVRIALGGFPTWVWLRHVDFEEGLHLLVGRDVEARVHMRRLLADAMLWAAGIMVALGSLGAWLVRGYFRAMLAGVSEVAAAIGAGNLSQRVQVTGQGDEFDLLAETINDMLDRISRLMDGVRQVSNAIAHDLRTPITRARVRLEDAATHASTAEELRAAVVRAEADLDGVVAVFQALLRIAEIEAGSRRSAFAAFDLAPLLRDLGELYDAAAEASEQRLELDVPPTLPAYGDRDMIQQAVANLLDNALKFSPAGGVITLRATAEPQGVRLEVTDEGPGIPEQDRERATERFFRGDAARSTSGSGLGLALVQAVATLHGRPLSLEDNAPGLRAFLHLPGTAG